jgi:hypothetical protein
MKLLRVGPIGSERRIVLLTGSTESYDASSVFTDFDRDFFEASGVERLRVAVGDGKLPKVDISNRRIGAPLSDPQKLFALDSTIASMRVKETWRFRRNQQSS